ncbi:CMRF35-like molecule 1 [Brachyistius frenatus]|uniref:CMRF35-like molecule 1 n=1 Tax=Brachyistius frenatus TaxID=100188 RepID=UPI0037E6F92C
MKAPDTPNTQTQISVNITVKGVEGQRFDFRCKYPDNQKSHAKYFCLVDDNEPCGHLVKTDKHDQWTRDGRWSLFDNTTEAVFTVRVDKLKPDDSGTYLCGVDVPFDQISIRYLSVSQVIPAFPMDPAMNKLHFSLFLAAVMFMVALLFVCLFTLCLLRAVKQRRSDLRHNREASSDYETMMAGVGPEPELGCGYSDPNCPDCSALPPPPEDFSRCTSKHRVSTVSVGVGDYVDVAEPGHTCHYQRLDVSQLEEHVYHNLHRKGDSKHEPCKEHINC